MFFKNSCTTCCTTCCLIIRHVFVCQHTTYNQLTNKFANLTSLY